MVCGYGMCHWKWKPDLCLKINDRSGRDRNLNRWFFLTNSRMALKQSSFQGHIPSTSSRRTLREAKRFRAAVQPSHRAFKTRLIVSYFLEHQLSGLLPLHCEHPAVTKFDRCCWACFSHFVCFLKFSWFVPEHKIWLFVVHRKSVMQMSMVRHLLPLFGRLVMSNYYCWTTIAIIYRCCMAASGESIRKINDLWQHYGILTGLFRRRMVDDSHKITVTVMMSHENDVKNLPGWLTWSMFIPCWGNYGVCEQINTLLVFPILLPTVSSPVRSQMNQSRCQRKRLKRYSLAIPKSGTCTPGIIIQNPLSIIVQVSRPFQKSQSSIRHDLHQLYEYQMPSQC